MRALKSKITSQEKCVEFKEKEINSLNEDYEKLQDEKESLYKDNIELKEQIAIEQKQASQAMKEVNLIFLYARLVGTYYGMALASVRLSVRPSVCLSTKLVDTIQTEPF